VPNKQYLLPVASTSGSGGGGGSVSSVFTRTGVVTAQTGDYSVAQVTGAAPLASPTFTGTVTLPAALQLANTTTLSPTSGTTVTLETPSNTGLDLIAPSGLGTAAIVLSAGNVQITGASGESSASIVLNDNGSGVGFDGIVNSYNANNLTNAGIATILASSKVTAQTAAIGATTLLSTPAAGMYRISYVATLTTAGTTSSLGGTTGFQIRFTNGNGDTVVKTSNPTTANISAANTTGTCVTGVVCGYAGSGTHIQYLFGYTAGSPTTGAYDLAAYVEYLG